MKPIGATNSGIPGQGRDDERGDRHPIFDRPFHLVAGFGSIRHSQGMNVLFICSQNKLRSPTAEQIFATYPGIEVDSAGTNADAENPLTPELVRWADLIFVMEKAHRSKLQRRYRSDLKDARLICLDIPDEYEFMDEGLVRLLKNRVTRFLRCDRPETTPLRTLRLARIMHNVFG